MMRYRIDSEKSDISTRLYVLSCGTLSFSFLEKANSTKSMAVYA